MKVPYNEVYNTIINLIDPEKFGDIKEVIEYLKDRPDQFTDISLGAEGSRIQNVYQDSDKISVKLSSLGETVEYISKNDDSFKNIENVPQFLELLQYMSSTINLDEGKEMKSKVIKNW